MMGFLEEVLTSNAAVVTGTQMEIDSKANRKVEDGDAIVFMVENLGGDAMQFAMQARMLLKLH